MDNDRLKNNWQTMKERIQKEHPHLSEDDLKYEIGKESELLERLQLKMDNWLSIMG